MRFSLTKERRIESKVFSIRGRNVMLDYDLALLYGVTTKRLNEQVKRNRRRFPEDFMFKLTRYEKNELVANCDRLENLKHSASMPNAFTEPGVAMLSSILNSERAIRVNIQIIRTFIKLREFMFTNRELAQKLSQLEAKVGQHDGEIKSIFEAIRQLTSNKEPKRKIGFAIS